MDNTQVVLPQGRFSGYQRNELAGLPADDEITRIMPGTPCGEYLRRFWMPIALTSMVGEAAGRFNRGRASRTLRPTVEASPDAPTWPPAPFPVPVLPGIDGRRQRIVDRIKANPAYTPLVIGQLLRIENTGSVNDSTAPFPGVPLAQIRPPCRVTSSLQM